MTGVVRITNHKDMAVWQQAMDMVDHVYEVTAHFPKEEIFGLTSQMRRSAVSIPSNIAEGSGRNHTKEYIQCLGIAKGSLAELETQLLIAIRRNYVKDQSLQQKLLSELDNIGKQLYMLMQSLRRKL